MDEVFRNGTSLELLNKWISCQESDQTGTTQPIVVGCQESDQSETTNGLAQAVMN